jgi:NAD(P)-dependent dehydrogenase (short-subunit alcohol dehydrogenase family)
LLAEVLADRGATVVILTKDPAIVPIEKRHVHYYICDVSEWKAVRDVAGIVQKEVSMELGRPRPCKSQLRRIILK